MDFNLFGLVRRFVKIVPDARRPIRLSNLESLIFSKCEPDGTDTSRAGCRFTTALTNGFTGRAPLQALPGNNTANFVLYNPEPDYGKSYCVEEIGAILLSGTMATAGAGIILKVSSGRAGTPSPIQATGYQIQSTSKAARRTRAIFADNTNVQSASDSMLIYASTNAGTTTIGNGLIRDMQGRILIPPGRMIGWTVMTAAGTTPLFLGHAVWTELELDLE